MEIKEESHKNNGAIAIITVVLVTMLVSIFAVGLAVMNLDYSLSIGSQLLDKSLTSTDDGCIDAAIGQFSAYNGTGSTNITNIGSSNLNCSVTVTSSGNKRYLLSRTTSTLPFVNSVKNASSTINAAANPLSITRFLEEVEAPSNVFSDGGNINATSSSGLYASVAVDGQFAYISYRDGNSGNKLTVTKVNLNTFAIVGSVTNISSTAAVYEDSVIAEGYLYVNYREYTGVNGSSEKLGVARIDLNNFTSTGVTLREDLTSGCATALCISSVDAVTVYGKVLYVAYRNEASGTNKLELKKIDTASFAAGSFSTLTAISTGQPSSIDMVGYNGAIYIAYQDTGANTPRLTKVDVSSFTVTTSLSVDSGLSANYVGVTIIDSYAYFAWDEYNNSRNVTVTKIDTTVTPMTKAATLRTSTYGSYLVVDSDAGFIYVQSNNSANSVITMQKIDVRKFHTSGITTLTGYHSGDLYEKAGLVAPGGQYVYEADHNRSPGKARLIRIKVD